MRTLRAALAGLLLALALPAAADRADRRPHGDYGVYVGRVRADAGDDVLRDAIGIASRTAGPMDAGRAPARTIPE